jgi:hypothetical protein
MTVYREPVSLDEQKLQEEAPGGPPGFGRDENEGEVAQSLADLFARYEDELPWLDAPEPDRVTAAVLTEVVTLKLVLALLDAL